MTTKLAAQAAEELAGQLAAVHTIIDKAEEADEPLSTVLTAITSGWQIATMPREQLATLLALALVQLDGLARAADVAELIDAVTSDGGDVFATPGGGL